MGCNCGNKIVKTAVRFGNGLKNPDHDLLGVEVITTTGKTGKIVENVTNNDGDVVGYILSGTNGKKFSIFRNQILQEK